MSLVLARFHAMKQTERLQTAQHPGKQAVDKSYLAGFFVSLLDPRGDRLGNKLRKIVIPSGNFTEKPDMSG